MKIKSSYLLLTLLFCSAASASAPAPACTLTTTANFPFHKSQQQPDSEYATLEAATSKGVFFYLRAGHGVIRLEAWRSGRIVAATFLQEGKLDVYGDALSLEIQTSKGLVEAQCENVNAASADR
ncbi:MAG: hypothetical protein EOP06_09330 [Proteobacteria bacterium]|nr:MAG: hypothetical protein EOP06_09330 [Pseudomonadota bacterium]